MSKFHSCHGALYLNQLFTFQRKKVKTAYRRQYPIPEKLKTVLQEQIEQWLQEGVIRVAPVNTDFNNPITCATRKDLEGNYTGIRVYLDSRALNLLLPDDRFPIPLVKNVFRSNRLCKAKLL
jgi:hypothetical protein